MDGHDRKKLSAADISRQEWLDKYGSFLYCPDRDTLCVHMDGKWPTGCELEICIKDDPEYQKLQERIERNRQAAAEEHRMQKAAEKKSPPAPIRDQRNRIQAYRKKKMDEIHRLEERSQEAFHRNNPGLGHTLFNRANIMRRELKEWEENRA